VSDVITDTEIITEESDPDILRGAAIGAAAAAVLSEIFGDIDFIEVIAGAGLGALAAVLLGGRKEEVEVVVVYPESDLDLTLQSDFALE
jgi:DNA-binding transcriptional regulator LsrR (DeoR family)